MSRHRKGTLITLRDGRFQAQITLSDGTRQRLQPFPKGTSRAMALDKAEVLSEVASKRPAVTRSKVKEPVRNGSEWWKQLLEHRTRIGLTNVGGAYATHIQPLLDKHPSHVTTADCERLRDGLDTKVASGATSAKTAFNAWTVWTTAMKAASGLWKKDKPKSLKVREGDPCVGVAPPDMFESKDLQWLTPLEFLQLMKCEAVPAEWRCIYALGIYLFPRASELRALTWEDFDMVHGLVRIRHSFDDAGALKKTKTGNKGIRRFAVEPNLMPLLRDMHARANGTGPVITLPHRKWWALRLREHLQAAGVTRAELFSTDQTSKRLRFHDLRSTGLTWLAMRGDDPLKVMQRAGHSSFETTQKYIRTAEAIGGAIGDVFPAFATPQSHGESHGKCLTVENHCGGAGNRNAPGIRAVHVPAESRMVEGAEPIAAHELSTRNQVAVRMPPSESHGPSPLLDAALADAMLSMALRGMASRIALSFGGESTARQARGQA